MAGRTHAQDSYRFGFNTQERDDEIAGVGNINTALFWEYDTRLARRWNRDPKEQKYPHQSPYCVLDNNPVFLVDINGDETNGDGKPKGSGGLQQAVVSKGEGPASVAQRSGTSLDALAKSNPSVFKNYDTYASQGKTDEYWKDLSGKNWMIYEGQNLNVPGKAKTSPPKVMNPKMITSKVLAGASSSKKHGIDYTNTATFKVNKGASVSFKISSSMGLDITVAEDVITGGTFDLVNGTTTNLEGNAKVLGVNVGNGAIGGGYEMNAIKGPDGKYKMEHTVKVGFIGAFEFSLTFDNNWGFKEGFFGLNLNPKAGFIYSIEGEKKEGIIFK